MHLAAALHHVALISLEIEIEMGERMIPDGACFVAQCIEFRQIRFGGVALDHETALDV